MVKSIPHQAPAAKRLIQVSTWYREWKRPYTRVFCLVDGQRDTRRIAELLTSPKFSVDCIVRDLTLAGFVRLVTDQGRSLSMDAITLRETMAKIETPAVFAARFYERLFESYLDTKILFENAKTDMAHQYLILMQTIALVITSVERGDDLTPTLVKLGKKHASKGVLPEHYPLVGEALLATFAEFLGDAWTPQVQAAWTEAYTLISETMIGQDG